MNNPVIPFQRRNRHPADDLADVRNEIKQLEIREAEIRAELLADAADRIGVQYEAYIRDQTQRRLDIPALIERFGADTIGSFYRKTSVRTLRLRRVSKTL